MDDQARREPAGGAVDEPAGAAGDECGRADEDEAARFVEGLIARGEAAEVDADGNLPEGATHELVIDAHGRRQAVRRRFFGVSDL